VAQKGLIQQLMRCNGFRCRLCPPTRPYICCNEHGLVKHVRKAHQKARPQGHQECADSLAQFAVYPIACQTFYRRTCFIRYFEVTAAPTSTQEAPQEPLADKKELSIAE
jgi:hypothetical protein